MEMEKTVMALKAKSDKGGIRTLAYQVAQITTLCTRYNIEIVDCVVVFGGVKDILRDLKKVDEKKQFDSVAIYSPNQICKDAEEYAGFVKEIQQQYEAQVRYVRNPY